MLTSIVLSRLFHKISTRKIIDPRKCYRSVSEMDYSNKTAIVAGGFGGIGYNVCKSLLAKGVQNLGIFDLAENTPLLTDLSVNFPESNVHFWKVDASQRSDVDNGFQAARTKFKTLDIVVNCVGVINEMQPERCIEINLLATIYLSYAAIDQMSISKSGTGGVVLNVASMVGVRPYFPVPIYSATKHAVVGFTRCLGTDFYLKTTGIKFITVCPGLTVTPMMKTSIESPIHDLKYFPNRLPRQSAEICASLLVEVLEQNKNGSMWKISEGVLEELVPNF